MGKSLVSCFFRLTVQNRGTGTDAKLESGVQRSCPDPVTDAFRTEPFSVATFITTHQQHVSQGLAAAVHSQCSSIHRVNWRHGIYGHDTFAILWV